jgi:hypothetical protein
MNPHGRPHSSSTRANLNCTVWPSFSLLKFEEDFRTTQVDIGLKVNPTHVKEIFKDWTGQSKP